MYEFEHNELYEFEHAPLSFNVRWSEKAHQNMHVDSQNEDRVCQFLQLK